MSRGELISHSLPHCSPFPHGPVNGSHSIGSTTKPYILQHSRVGWVVTQLTPYEAYTAVGQNLPFLGGRSPRSAARVKRVAVPKEPHPSRCGKPPFATVPSIHPVIWRIMYTCTRSWISFANVAELTESAGNIDHFVARQESRYFTSCPRMITIWC